MTPKRTVETVKREIATVEHSFAERLRLLAKETEKKKREVLRDVTSQVGKNKLEAEQAVTPLQARRDHARREALKDRDKAVARAHGDYERAIRQADETYAAERDRISTEEKARNQPLEAELLDRQGAILRGYEEEVSRLKREAGEVIGPLRKELEALEGPPPALSVPEVPKQREKRGDVAEAVG